MSRLLSLFRWCRTAYVAATVVRARWLSAVVLGLALAPGQARASLTVLIGEPFGSFGRMMPVGHAALYLDRVCADGPLKVRMCHPGEQAGVVVARYHQIGRTDWIATPVMEFLYAVDRPADVLPWTTKDTVWALRERYRDRYMPDLVPDGTEHDKAANEWWETAGVAYNRKLWGYRLDTSVAQDERFVTMLNADSNEHRYTMSKSNCADFVADMVNFYYPGAVRRSLGADFGWETPKNLARCVDRFGLAHPELHLEVFEVPQVPGTLVRSRPAWGAAESGVKVKTYFAILMLIQPEVPITCTVLYLAHGRFPLGRGAEPEPPGAFYQRMPVALASAPAGDGDVSGDMAEMK